MRIGFDISQITGNKAGCGFFAKEILDSLLQIDSTNSYILYPLFYNFVPHYKLIYPLATKKLAPNFSYHFSPWNPVRYLQKRSEWLRNIGPRTAWLGNPDIVHSNNFSCATDHNAKIVYTLYDTVPLTHPEFTTSANWAVCAPGLYNASFYADHIIAISEFSKNSFLKYFPYYPEERISVVPLGVRGGICAIEKSAAKKWLARYNLPPQFIFSAGTVEIRKNYATLIEAYAAGQFKIPLVIAGGSGWMASDLPQLIKKKKLEKQIQFLGYVTDEEMSALMSLCELFVYPSFYEGFGLPVLEAMHCGAAVACGETSSLPEVGGDAAEYFNPQSAESIKNSLQLLLNSEEKIKTLRQKSLARSQQFSWQKAAQQVLSIYQKTLEKPFYNRI